MDSLVTEEDKADAMTRANELKRKPRASRNELTLDKKVELIEMSMSTKMSHRKLAAKFGIGKTQVQSILKRQEEILQWRATETADKDPKRRRVKAFSAYEEINLAMWHWYQGMKEAGIAVSGVHVREKALEYAKLFGANDFKASEGWLCRFRIRHRVSFRANQKEEKANEGFKEEEGEEQEREREQEQKQEQKQEQEEEEEVEQEVEDDDDNEDEDEDEESRIGVSSHAEAVAMVNDLKLFYTEKRVPRLVQLFTLADNIMQDYGFLDPDPDQTSFTIKQEDDHGCDQPTKKPKRSRSASLLFPESSSEESSRVSDNELPNCMQQRTTTPKLGRKTTVKNRPLIQRSAIKRECPDFEYETVSPKNEPCDSHDYSNQDCSSLTPGNPVFPGMTSFNSNDSG